MNVIRILREQRGMTQDQFAEYCGVSKISITRYEAGSPVNRTNAQKIATACNVSLDFIYGVQEVARQPDLRAITAALIDELSPEELEQVRSYAEFVRSKRK